MTDYQMLRPIYQFGERLRSNRSLPGKNADILIVYRPARVDHNAEFRSSLSRVLKRKCSELNIPIALPLSSETEDDTQGMSIYIPRLEQ